VMILVGPSQCLPKNFVGLAEPREGSRELTRTRPYSASSGPCDIRDSSIPARLPSMRSGTRRCKRLGQDLPVFQVESWLTRLCFNWSEWATGCQPDALEHLVHRFGPILAPRIGSVLFWPGFMATKPVTEAIGIATAR
jgi:hypothetical protein